MNARVMTCALAGILVVGCKGDAADSSAPARAAAPWLVGYNDAAAARFEALVTSRRPLARVAGATRLVERVERGLT